MSPKKKAAAAAARRTPARTPARKPAAGAKAGTRATPAAKSGQNKTVATGASVAGFIATVPDPRRREEARVVLELMQRVTGERARMWGPSIIGFGSYHYRYESGREGDMVRAGFSPRKAALTLYIMGGFPRYAPLLARLGPHTTGASCLYLKRLSDVDLGVLEELVRGSWAWMASRYPE